MTENFLGTNGFEIIKKVMELKGLKNRTSKLWNSIFNEYIIPMDFILENHSYCKSEDIKDIVLKQLIMMNDNNIDIPISYRNWLKDNLLGEKLSVYIINLFIDTAKYHNEEDKLFLQDVIRKNNFYLDEDIKLKCINYIGINNAFICNIANEESVKAHEDEFDFNLIPEYGIKDLSFEWISEHMPEEKKISMCDINLNDRPNIGIDKMPGYESGGLCIDDKLYNGFNLYIPYGITTEIMDSIDYSLNLLVRNITEAKDIINKCSNLEDNVATAGIIDIQKEVIKKSQKSMFVLNALLCALNDV